MARDPVVFDPYRNFKFRLKIDNGQAGFAKIGPLSETSDVIPYREGNWRMGITVKKIPGLVNYGDLNCSRGLTDDQTLKGWRATVALCADGVTLDGAFSASRGNYKKTIVMELLDKGEPGLATKSWIIHRAWPISLQIGDWDAHGRNVVIETMVLANEGIEEKGEGIQGLLARIFGAVGAVGSGQPGAAADLLLGG